MIVNTYTLSNQNILKPALRVEKGSVRFIRTENFSDFCFQKISLISKYSSGDVSFVVHISIVLRVLTEGLVDYLVKSVESIL